MLTKNEFLAKHENDYKDLSRAERDARYRAYVEQQRRESNGAVARTRPTSAPRVARATSSRDDVRASSMPRAEHKALSQTSDLARAMLNPFALADVGAAPPRIPDGEFTATVTALMTRNVIIESDADGHVAFFMRLAPWGAYATSTKDSKVGPTDLFKANLERNAFAAYATRAASGYYMPAWSADAWSMPAQVAAIAAAPPVTYGAEDMAESDVIFSNSNAWRPVCGGAEMQYTAAALEASGEMCCALVPAAVGSPNQGDSLFTMGPEADSLRQDTSMPNCGPTFETLQTMPQAKVFKAVSGARTIWHPQARQAQTHWRSTKPRPHTTCFGIGASLALSQVSGTPVTGYDADPPPVTGDTARMQALIDRMYSENGWVMASGITAGTTGGGTNLLFIPDSGDQDANNEEMARFKQTLMLQEHRYGMHPQDSYIMWVGRGYPASTTIGTIRIVIGIEYLPDTRQLTLGGGHQTATRAEPAHVQVDAHARTLALLKAVPPSAPETAGQNSFIKDAASVVRGGVGLVKDVASGVEELAGVIGPILAAL